MSILTSLRAALLRVWALIEKECTTLFLDPSLRRILIVPVIAQSVLFGYGATFNLERVPCVILDEARGAASSELVRRVRENGVFVEVAAPRNLAAFERAIDEGEALVGLHFPADFERRRANPLLYPDGAPVYLAADARNTTTANVASGYVAAIVEEFNVRSGAAGAFRVVERFRFNENAVTRWNIMPALILALSMLQVMLLAGLSVSREREEGTFDMMLMTPLSPVEILIGKALPPVVVGVAQGFLIYAVSRFWFEIPCVGSTAALFAVVTLFSVSVVGLALAVSAWSKTIQQSVIYAFFIVLPSLILSGLMTPVAAMPEWMRTATILNPARCGIDAVRRIYFEGARWSEIWPELWPLVLIGAASLPFAARLLRSRTV